MQKPVQIHTPTMISAIVFARRVREPGTAAGTRPRPTAALSVPVCDSPGGA